MATNDTNNFHLNEAMNKKPMQVNVVLCEKERKGESREETKSGSSSWRNFLLGADGAYEWKFCRTTGKHNH